MDQEGTAPALERNLPLLPTPATTTATAVWLLASGHSGWSSIQYLALAVHWLIRTPEWAVACNLGCFCANRPRPSSTAQAIQVHMWALVDTAGRYCLYRIGCRAEKHQTTGKKAKQTWEKCCTQRFPLFFFIVFSSIIIQTTSLRPAKKTNPTVFNPRGAWIACKGKETLHHHRVESTRAILYELYLITGDKFGFDTIVQNPQIYFFAMASTRLILLLQNIHLRVV